MLHQHSESRAAAHRQHWGAAASPGLVSDLLSLLVAMHNSTSRACCTSASAGLGCSRAFLLDCRPLMSAQLVCSMLTGIAQCFLRRCRHPKLCSRCSPSDPEIASMTSSCLSCCRGTSPGEAAGAAAALLAGKVREELDRGRHRGRSAAEGGLHIRCDGAYAADQLPQGLHKSSAVSVSSRLHVKRSRC